MTTHSVCRINVDGKPGTRYPARPGYIQSMHNNLPTPIARIYLPIIAAVTLLTCSTPVFSWGHNGHGVVGMLAVEQLQSFARSELEKIIGPLNQQSMLEACNWPDEVRESEEWEWTYPLHYINIPRGDFQYLESRDCPDQMCATQAIKRYASELGDVEASTEKRSQAFAWLCHITGDLHQPLHAGFADDRGGNNFVVNYKGEQTNLHSLWDSKLIGSQTDGIHALHHQARAVVAGNITETWSPPLVNNWTNESHQLAKNYVYPVSRQIDNAYEVKNWPLLLERLNLAAIRLASIINSELDEEQPEQ